MPRHPALVPRRRIAGVSRFNLLAFALVFSLALAPLLAAGPASLAQSNPPANPAARRRGCAGDNGGITCRPASAPRCSPTTSAMRATWPSAPTASLYVNTWSGRYYRAATPPRRRLPGRAAGHQRRRQGRRDRALRRRRGGRLGRRHRHRALQGLRSTPRPNDKHRPLPAAGIRRASCRRRAARPWSPGMPLSGDHPMHPFVIDAKGQLYRRHGLGHQLLPGREPDAAARRASALHRARDPRRHLALRRQQDRTRSSRRPSATPPASATARACRFDAAGRLFVTQHGRDQLPQNWAKLYTDAARRRTAGRGAGAAAAGRRLRLARMLLRRLPEQAGAGAGIRRRRRQEGRRLRARRQPPVAAFPAHWAPNDLLIYNGNGVPGGLPRRRLHRLPRLVEPRAGAAGRLQRGVPAAGRRQGRRATTSCSPTASPVRSRTRASAAHPADRPRRRRRTARSTSPTTRTAASGA